MFVFCPRVDQRIIEDLFNIHDWLLPKSFFVYFLFIISNLLTHKRMWLLSRLAALVGPPSRVVLSPAGGGLDVRIFDPKTSTNSSMKELLPELYYHIVYWEDRAGSQVAPPPLHTSLFLFHPRRHLMKPGGGGLTSAGCFRSLFVGFDSYRQHRAEVFPPRKASKSDTWQWRWLPVRGRWKLLQNMTELTRRFGPLTRFTSILLVKT